MPTSLSRNLSFFGEGCPAVRVVATIAGGGQRRAGRGEGEGRVRQRRVEAKGARSASRVVVACFPRARLVSQTATAVAAPSVYAFLLDVVALVAFSVALVMPPAGIPPSRALPSKETGLFKEVLHYYEDRQLKKGLKTADTILKKFPNHGGMSHAVAYTV